MFDNNCQVCASRVLIFPSQVTSLANTDRRRRGHVHVLVRHGADAGHGQGRPRRRRPRRRRLSRAPPGKGACRP